MCYTLVYDDKNNSVISQYNCTCRIINRYVFELVVVRDIWPRDKKT